MTVQAFVKPEGQRLRLLVRVPLKSITDVEYARRGRDYVDLERVDAALDAAARQYVANQIELYEDGALLPAPRIVSTRISLESDRSFNSYDAALAHVTGQPLSQRNPVLGTGTARRPPGISRTVGSLGVCGQCALRPPGATRGHGTAVSPA